MADEPITDPAEQKPAGEPDKTYTRSDVDRIIAAEVRKATEKITAEAENAKKTEAEKLLARIEAAEAKAAQYEAREARARLVDTIADEAKLDDKAKKLLSKSAVTDEAALRDLAKELSAFVTAQPTIPKPLYGGTGEKTKTGDELAARAHALSLLKRQ